MDDIDRPGELQRRIKSPVSLESNRPPVAMDETQEFDEVDRPAPPKKKMSEDEKHETGDKGTEVENEEILPSLLPNRTTESQQQQKQQEETTDIDLVKDEKKSEEEILPSLKNGIDLNEFVILDTPEKDSTDSPFNSTTTNEDGRLSVALSNTLFGKNSKISVLNRAERQDKEGFNITHKTYNPLPLSKQPQGKFGSANEFSDSFYKMDTYPRGKLYLINVKYFRRSSGMADYPREGTDKDADGLTKLFVDLGFVVERFDNPSKQEIMHIMKIAANDDYSKLSCCACAMLSHGEEGIIYGNDDYVKIKDITKMFRSRSLAGKPKFFIFQACQGSEYMNPVEDQVDGPGRRQQTDEELALTLPSEADFLYAYSTVPGYYSWRNSRRGSWFVEGLIKLFRENAHKMDVMRMLVRVNQLVAFRKSRTDDIQTDNKRQISSLVTQMRKDFYLCPPHGPLSPAE